MNIYKPSQSLSFQNLIDLAVINLKEKHYDRVLNIFKTICQERTEGILVQNLIQWGEGYHNEKKAQEILRIFSAYLFDNSKKELCHKILNSPIFSTAMPISILRSHSAPTWINTAKVTTPSQVDREKPFKENTAIDLFQKCFTYKRELNFVELFNTFTILSHLDFTADLQAWWSKTKTTETQLKKECLKNFYLYLHDHQKSQKAEILSKILNPLVVSQPRPIEKSKSLNFKIEKEGGGEEQFFQLNSALDYFKHHNKQFTEIAFSKIVQANSFYEILPWFGDYHPSEWPLKIRLVEAFVAYLFKKNKYSSALIALDYLKSIRKREPVHDKAQLLSKWHGLKEDLLNSLNEEVMIYFFFSFPKAVREHIIEEYRYTSSLQKKIEIQSFFSFKSKKTPTEILPIYLHAYFHPKIDQYEKRFSTRIFKRILQSFKEDFDLSFASLEAALPLIQSQGGHLLESESFQKKSSFLFKILFEKNEGHERRGKLWNYFIDNKLVNKKTSLSLSLSPEQIEDYCSKKDDNSSSQNIFELEEILDKTHETLCDS